MAAKKTNIKKGMAAKKTKIKIKPIFLSHEKLAKVYQLTKKDKKILNPLERKASAAFEKPMTPDVALASVVGSNAMPRVEVTKKIWAYIKKNKLQDTTNKRMINAGDKLKDVFGGKKQVSMFEITRLVNKHLNPLDRKASAALEKPMTPDAALASVVGSNAMPRVEVTKKIWAYIKKNKLQDTKNKRMINAGDKLKDVFDGKKQVSMFEMTKLVSKHLK